MASDIVEQIWNGHLTMANERTRNIVFSKRLSPTPETTARAVHRIQQIVARRRVHEIELEHIVDAERLEQQHRVAEIGALNLGNVGHQHLVLEHGLRVQTWPKRRAER